MFVYWNNHFQSIHYSHSIWDNFDWLFWIQMKNGGNWPNSISILLQLSWNKRFEFYWFFGYRKSVVNSITFKTKKNCNSLILTKAIRIVFICILSVYMFCLLELVRNLMIIGFKLIEFFIVWFYTLGSVIFFVMRFNLVKNETI